ncbi:MAG: winged helix-turn-helix transcriptional regulator [Nitrososphaerales archaeon]
MIRDSNNASDLVEKSVVSRENTNADSLDAGNRERILQFITRHPGVHLREIKRGVNLAMGMIQYHLTVLEKDRRIVPLRSGIYKRFYPNFVFGDSQMVLLGALSQEVEREIILFIIQNPGATQKDIAGFANISPPTINWHMKKLISLGIVEEKHTGTFVKYWVKGDHGQIIAFIKSYHQNIWEKWASRLADLVTDSSGIEATTDEKKHGAADSKI